MGNQFFPEELLENANDLEVRIPKDYLVLMLNDDYTTQEFVIRMLVSIFQMTESNAYQVMLDVHHKGSGLCGQYQKEIAEAKIAQVHRKAESEGFPLRCKVEKVN